MNYIARHICSFVHYKMKTEFMQTVNLLTIELQLRFKVSNNCRFLKKSLKNRYKNLIFSLKPGLKYSSDS